MLLFSHLTPQPTAPDRTRPQSVVTPRRFAKRRGGLNFQFYAFCQGVVLVDSGYTTYTLSALFFIRFKLVETDQHRAVTFSQPKRQHCLPFASRSGQNRRTARRVHRVAEKSLMLSFEKFAGAGVRLLQPPLFSVFPQSAPVWGAARAMRLRAVGGALLAKADETGLNRS